MIENKRLHNLHAIRGWAALFVVIAHAKYPFWSGGREYLNKYPIETWDTYQYILFGIDMLTSFTELFVIIFFVLSGYFITRSLKINNYAILFFYGDRIIRIYIPYIGSLFIGFIALYIANYIHPELFTMSEITRPYNVDLINSHNDLTVSAFLSAIMFLPGESGHFFAMNSPSWSLYFEALFYIIIPFVLLYLKKYMLIILAFILFMISFFYGGNWLTIKAFIFSYSIYFAMGVFLFEVTHTKKSRYFIIKKVRSFSNLILGASIFLLFSAITLGLLGFKKYGFFLGMISAVLLILIILYGRNTKFLLVFKKIVINDFSNLLGKISFSLYLVHVPIMALYYSLWTKYVNEYIFYDRIYWIAVVCVIPMGYLHYLVFEKNALKLSQKL